MKKGGYPLSRASMPNTTTKDHAEGPLRCSRTCCWTPFGHKVDAKNCNCHAKKESLYV